MELEGQTLPTPLSLVVRRVDVTDSSDLAMRWLSLSYVFESLIKQLAISLTSGIRRSAPAVAHKLEYELVRSDGLGTWEKVIGTSTAHAYAGYLDSDLQPLVAWVTKKRGRHEDEWVRIAAGECASILDELGAVDVQIPRRLTIRFVMSQMVQIRNKTKAHGAVGPDFFELNNPRYARALSEITSRCPLVKWDWFHLTTREKKDTVRAILLRGPAPRHVRSAEADQMTPEHEGIHFRTHPRGRLFHCGQLLSANRECSKFHVPNGGYTGQGDAEFIDYGSGDVIRVALPQFLRPPAPLPPSTTEGSGALEVFTNVFGNIPPPPRGFVHRPALERELFERIRDQNHSIVALHGRGGIGKTSLALHVAHVLADEETLRFDHILWFSARDLELDPRGATEVRRAVAGLDEVSQLLAQLLDIESSLDVLASLLRNPDLVGSTGILFVFDNFETLDHPKEVHRFLGTHTHSPNKVLITSRERAFKGDWPIEVGGMEYEEAATLVSQDARELRIEGLVTDAVTDEIIEYTGGHPYVMRVLLGEMAIAKRRIPLKSFVQRRSDLLNVVFERSFNKLSANGRRAFLCVTNWRSVVPELALLVVLELRELDAELGLEECRRLALLAEVELSDGTAAYSAPELARLFGKKKLKGDPDRLLVQEDLDLLREFGPVQPSDIARASSDVLVNRFLNGIHERSKSANAEETSRLDSVLRNVAELWPPAWAELAKLRINQRAPAEDVDYALRRAIEEKPYDKEAWLARARFARDRKDEPTEIAALVGAVDADPADVELVRDVAVHLTSYISERKVEIPQARRGVYLASVRAHMERVAFRLDATGLSRLAWLYLLEGDYDGCWKYAAMGLEKEPHNFHCDKLVNRLRSQGQSPPDAH